VRVTGFLVLLIGAGPLGAFAQGNGPRGVREAILVGEHALDEAIRQVSRPSPTGLFGPTQSVRGYRIPSVGVVFVVPPRCVPSARLARWHHRGPKEAVPAATPQETPAPGTQEAQALPSSPPAMVGLSVPAPHSREELMEALRSAEEQAQSMHALNVMMQQEMDRALSQMPPDAKALFHTAPLLAPPLGEPWEPDDRTPAQVIRDVRMATIRALAASDWTMLPKGESVSVAVEFYDEWALDPSERPVRTVSMRIEPSDLAAVKRGELSPDALGKRCVSIEY
jgi:hypothetical protein